MEDINFLGLRKVEENWENEKNGTGLSLSHFECGPTRARARLWKIGSGAIRCWSMGTVPLGRVQA